MTYTMTEKINQNMIQYLHDTYGDHSEFEQLHINYWQDESYVLLKQDHGVELLKCTIANSGQITASEGVMVIGDTMESAKKKWDFMFQIGRDYGNQEANI